MKFRVKIKKVIFGNGHCTSYPPHTVGMIGGLDGSIQIPHAVGFKLTSTFSILRKYMFYWGSVLQFFTISDLIKKLRPNYHVIQTKYFEKIKFFFLQNLRFFQFFLSKYKIYLLSIIYITKICL